MTKLKKTGLDPQESEYYILKLMQGRFIQDKDFHTIMEEQTHTNTMDVLNISGWINF